MIQFKKKYSRRFILFEFAEPSRRIRSHTPVNYEDYFLENKHKRRLTPKVQSSRVGKLSTHSKSGQCSQKKSTPKDKKKKKNQLDLSKFDLNHSSDGSICGESNKSSSDKKSSPIIATQRKDRSSVTVVTLDDDNYVYERVSDAGNQPPTGDYESNGLKEKNSRGEEGLDILESKFRDAYIVLHDIRKSLDPHINLSLKDTEKPTDLAHNEPVKNSKTLLNNNDEDTQVKTKPIPAGRKDSQNMDIEEPPCKPTRTSDVVDDAAALSEGCTFIILHSNIYNVAIYVFMLGLKSNLS